MLGGIIFFFFLKMRSLAGLELTKYTNLTGQEDQESAALGLQVCVTMPAFLTYRFWGLSSGPCPGKADASLMSCLPSLSLFSSIRKALSVGDYNIVVIAESVSNFLINSSVSFWGLIGNRPQRQCLRVTIFSAVVRNRPSWSIWLSRRCQFFIFSLGVNLVFVNVMPICLWSSSLVCRLLRDQDRLVVRSKLFLCLCCPLLWELASSFSQSEVDLNKFSPFKGPQRLSEYDPYSVKHLEMRSSHFQIDLNAIGVSIREEINMQSRRWCGGEWSSP